MSIWGRVFTICKSWFWEGWFWNFLWNIQNRQPYVWPCYHETKCTCVAQFVLGADVVHELSCHILCQDLFKFIKNNLKQYYRILILVKVFFFIYDWLSLCGLVMPYGSMDRDQHWIRLWLVARWPQAITWADVDFLSPSSVVTHLN